MTIHGHTKQPSDFIPAASVIVVNQNAAEPRLLLVHRSPSLRFHGDLWAFPGGHIETVDRVSDHDLDTARQCAIRETREETGLHLKNEALVHLARWFSPSIISRRFDTWFFLAVGNYKNVRVDGSEIIDHAWCPASRALLEHNQHIRKLTPPTFVLLSRLAGADHRTYDRQTAANHPVTYFRGRLVDLPDGRCVLYEEDEAYGHGNLSRPGPRHRLWILASGWKYENEY